MEKSAKDLIQALTEGYGPRPWWKKPWTLFALWFSAHIIYFVALAVFRFEALVLRSSLLYVCVELLGAFFVGLLFVTLSRYQELKASSARALFGMILLWMMLAFFMEDTLMGTVLHGRNFSPTARDLGCFWHATLSTVGPVMLFPILFRQFFFARPTLAFLFMSFHLALLGSVLNELKCPDREMWHLVLGHQTTVVGVGVLMMLTLFVAQRRVSLKLSGREKQSL